MLYVCIVAHQSSIILTSSIVPDLFFTIIIVSLIDVPYIFVCYISQDNVFCACLSSLTRKPPSQGMTEKQECLIEVKTKEGYNLWVIYTKDTELRKKTEVREDSGG